MIIPAPLISIGTEPPVVPEKICWITIGEIAIRARNTPPNRFSLLDTFARYSAVCLPGLIPGINPPLFWIFSAICSGLKVIET